MNKFSANKSYSKNQHFYGQIVVQTNRCAQITCFSKTGARENVICESARSMKVSLSGNVPEERLITVPVTVKHNNSALQSGIWPFKV